MRPRNAVVAVMNAVPRAVARRFRGESRIAGFVRPVVNRVLPKGPAWVTVRAGRGIGLRLLIDPREEKYYWTGLYEPEVQAIVTQHLKPGDVMWDVGAHIGFLAAIASRAVGPTGLVVAFEPLEENVGRLSKTVEANGLANVTIREAALSSSAGSSPFFVHRSTLMGGLSGASDAPRVEVATTTLDAELTSLGPPTLVKIDVERYEGEVIAGGQRLFNDVRPLLIIELLNDQAEARARTLLRRYTLRRLDGHNFIADPTS